MTNFK